MKSTTLALFALFLLLSYASGQSWQPMAADSRAGHGSTVYSAVFSADSKYLASYDQAGTIVIWDLASQKPVTRIDDTDSEAFKEPVFSPDGKILAAVVERQDDPTVLFEESIRFWELPSGKPLPSPEGSFRGIEHLTFSPDSKTLFAEVEMKRTESWDIATLKTKGSPMPYLGPFAFDAKGTRLSLATPDNKSAVVLDAVSGKRIRVIPGYNFVVSLAFSPNGRFLAVNDETEAAGIRLKMIDLTTGRAIAGFDTVDQHPTAAFTSQGSAVLVQFEKTFADEPGSTSRIGALHDPATGRKQKDLMVNGAINGFGTTFSRDGRFLAVRSSSSVTNTIPDTELRIVDLTTGRISATLHGYRRTVTSLAFSADGRELFTAHPGARAIAWTTDGWKPVRVFSAGSDEDPGPTFINGSKYFSVADTDLFELSTGKKFGNSWKSHLAVSGDGRVMLVADDEQFSFLSVPGQEVRSAFPKPFEWTERSFALDKTGGKFAAGQDGSLGIFDSRTGKLLNRFPISKGTISEIVYAPDDRYIGLMNSESASTTSRFTLNILDAGTGKVVFKTPKETQYFSFSPDGSNIVSLDVSDRLLITRIADGRTLMESKVRVKKFAEGLSFAYHPTLPLIAVGTEYGTQVFDISSGAQLARLR